MRIQSAKDLTVYKLAFKLAMDIFEATKRFPPEEKFAHFLSKLSDCDGENSETDSWVDFARDCGYISGEQHEQLAAQCAEVGWMLGGLIRKPESFLAAGHLISDV